LDRLDLKACSERILPFPRNGHARNCNGILKSKRALKGNIKKVDELGSRGSDRLRARAQPVLILCLKTPVTRQRYLTTFETTMTVKSSSHCHHVSSAGQKAKNCPFYCFHDDTSEKR
jgi:hypothetical protein